MDPTRVEEDVLAVLLIVRRMGSSLADRRFGTGSPDSAHCLRSHRCRSVSPVLKAADSIRSADHDWQLSLAAS